MPKYKTAMNEEFATIPRLKEGGTWYVYFQVWHPGKNRLMPKKITKGFKQRETTVEKRAWGKQLCKEYEAKLRTGWSPWDKKETVIYTDQISYHNQIKITGSKRRTVKNVRFYLSAYLSWKKLKRPAKKTFQSYQSKTRKFCLWLEENKYGNFDVCEISNKLVIRFFKHLIDVDKLDKRTVQKYHQNIYGFFEYLKKEKKILRNPVYDIPTAPKRKDEAARPINRHDLKLLLDTIKENDPQLFMACMFQYYLGARPGQELRLLKIKDLDFYNHKVTIIEENAKTVRRTIDMSVDLAQLCLEAQLQHFNRDYYVFGREKVPGTKPLGQNTLRNRFNKYRDQLELPSIYKFYSMKHTAAGYLLESGRTIEELRDHLGHTDITSTFHYIKKHFGNRNENIINKFPSPL